MFRQEGETVVNLNNAVHSNQVRSAVEYREKIPTHFAFFPSDTHHSPTQIGRQKEGVGCAPLPLLRMWASPIPRVGWGAHLKACRTTYQGEVIGTAVLWMRVPV